MRSSDAGAGPQRSLSRHTRSRKVRSSGHSRNERAPSNEKTNSPARLLRASRSLNGSATSSSMWPAGHVASTSGSVAASGSAPLGTILRSGHRVETARIQPHSSKSSGSSEIAESLLWTAPADIPRMPDGPERESGNGLWTLFFGASWAPSRTLRLCNCHSARRGVVSGRRKHD